MGTYKVEQHRLMHNDREFHFVSYDARPANERRGEEELPQMWFLMNAGGRIKVMPQTLGQEVEELEQLFHNWLDENVFAEAPSASSDKSA